MSKVMLIDYENVQGINLSEMHGMDFRVKIFTGNSQSKIPIELVTSAQVLGNQLEWIRIDGNGPNALDFHIAYYLGALIAKDPGDDYFILSKDKGFDPLIKYITKRKIYCRRILAISDVASIKGAFCNDELSTSILGSVIFVFFRMLKPIIIAITPTNIIPAISDAAAIISP